MKVYIIEYNNKIFGVYNDYQQLENFINSSIQNNFIIKENVDILTFNINSCYLVNRQKFNNNIVVEKVNNNEETSNNNIIVVEEIVNNNVIVKETSNNNVVVEVEKVNNNEETSNNNVVVEVEEVNNNVIVEEKVNNNEETSNNNVVVEKVNNNEEIVNNETFVIDEAVKKEKILSLSEQKKELQHKINMLRLDQQKIKDCQNEYIYNLKLFELFKNKLVENDTFVIPELFIDKYNVMLELEKNNKLSWENYYNRYVSKLLNNNSFTPHDQRSSKAEYNDLFNKDNFYNNKFY
jgi:hypothetical protein